MVPFKRNLLISTFAFYSFFCILQNEMLDFRTQISILPTVGVKGLRISKINYLEPGINLLEYS